jgi:hypothetical protein
MTAGTDPLLAGLLLIAALIAATDLYVILIRRRQRGRRDERQAQADRDAGVRNLLRLGLVDRPRSVHDGPDQGESRRTSRWVQRWRGMSSAPSARDDTSPEDDQVQASDGGS